MTVRLVFVGPPGVGKGTQADIMAERFGIPHISTGDMFRRAIREGTPMGQKAKPYVDAGSYVPDEVVNGIVAERLAMPDCNNGFILDGYPRTPAQAGELDAILRQRQSELTAVVSVQAPAEVVIRRLTGRRVCPQCGATYHVEFDPPQRAGVCDQCGAELSQRSDDREATVRERLEVYDRQTAPLIEHYRQRGLLLEVDGDAPVEEVAERIGRRLTVLLQKS